MPGPDTGVGEGHTGPLGLGDTHPGGGSRSRSAGHVPDFTTRMLLGHSRAAMRTQLFRAAAENAYLFLPPLPLPSLLWWSL